MHLLSSNQHQQQMISALGSESFLFSCVQSRNSFLLISPQS